MSSLQTDVVVIGGGIAGLTSAVGLCEQGLNVMVVERSDILGGRARSWTDEVTGDRIDIGPHILLTEYRNMLKLLDKLGTSDRIAWQKHMILADEPHPVTIKARRLPAPLQFLPSVMMAPQLSFLDRLSNLRVLWQALSLSEQDVLALDSRSALDHLVQMGVSQRSIEWFWQSAAMTILNVPVERCSAGALLQFIRYMIGRSGYQVGFAAEGLGDLFAPQAARLIESAGGQVLMNTKVARILGDGGKREIEKATGVELSDGRSIQARWVIAATPPQHLQPLLPGAWVQKHRMFQDLSSFEPSPYITSYIWFDRKLTQERFWTRVWSPTNLNYDFYDLSNIRSGWRDRPSVIAGNIIYSHRAEPLSDTEIVQRTLSELADFLPEAAQAHVRHTRVHRIPMAKSAPHPGIEHKRPSSKTPIHGLIVAGDWINTHLPGSMESAVRSGWLAAEAVLTNAGMPCSLAEPLPKVRGLARLVGALR